MCPTSSVRMGYIGSVVPFPSRPVALGPKSLLSQYIPCGTRACVTTITYSFTSNRLLAIGHAENKILTISHSFKLCISTHAVLRYKILYGLVLNLLLPNNYYRPHTHTHRPHTDVPDPPHSLISLSVTNTSMIVMWVEPHDRNAPISSYTVTYQHPSFLGGQEESVNSSAEMSFIGGLHPGVVYNFSVVAHNEFGVSEPSVVTGLATLDEGK